MLRFSLKLTGFFILPMFCFQLATASENEPGKNLSTPEAGFLRLSHPQVPAAVKSKSSSIFRIVEIASPEFSVKLSRDERDELLKEHCLLTENFLKALQCKALSGPANSGDQWFLPYLSAGTAFFAENSRTLWTVWHNLYQQNQPLIIFVSRAIIKWPMIERQAYMRNLVPEFLLFDGAGKLVFDSRVSKVKPKYLSNGDPVVREVYKDDKILSTALDFARIEMPSQFQRPPIKIAAEKLTLERLHLVGFPDRTAIASRGKTTSDGYNLYYNQGSMITLKDLLTRTDILDSTMNTVINHRLAPKILALNMDVQVGLSGGPLLNDQGELVGILTERIEDKDKNVLGAMGVRASWIQAFSADPERATPDSPKEK